jgi:hypothetical protein
LFRFESTDGVDRADEMQFFGHGFTSFGRCSVQSSNDAAFGPGMTWRAVLECIGRKSPIESKSSIILTFSQPEGQSLIYLRIPSI